MAPYGGTRQQSFDYGHESALSWPAPSEMKQTQCPRMAIRATYASSVTLDGAGRSCGGARGEKGGQAAISLQESIRTKETPRCLQIMCSPQCVPGNVTAGHRRDSATAYELQGAGTILVNVPRQ